MLPKTADIVVIGGGCVGTSVAYHLARRGAKDIVLVERERFLGMGSTSRAAGGVRHQFSTRVNIQLSLCALNALEHFEELFGVSCDYRPIGYLFLLSTPREAETFKRNLALQKSVGVEWVRWVAPDEIHRLAPRVNLDGVLGGTFCPKDGLADPNSVTQAFGRHAARLGAQIETETTVTGIKTNHARIASVVTNRGEIATRAVVCCAGAWSAEIGKMVGLDIPIAPIRRQLFVTSPLPQIPHDHPFTIEFSTSLYFHPEGNGLLVGMSNHDEKPGYNLAIDEVFRERTLECAVYRLPLLENAEIAREWAGLYEVTPDAHPILGEAKALAGLYIAAGFSGHGFMHSPATGVVMSEIILDGQSKTVDVSSLNLERFAEGKLIEEVNVI
jgi:sarcosine oxidase subunit beta